MLLNEGLIQWPGAGQEATSVIARRLYYIGLLRAIRIISGFAYQS